jgi:hypothetical protein
MRERKDKQHEQGEIILNPGDFDSAELQSRIEEQPNGERKQHDYHFSD